MNIPHSDGSSVTPIGVHRAIKTGARLYCAICGVTWPCLASQANARQWAVEARARLRAMGLDPWYLGKQDPPEST